MELRPKHREFISNYVRGMSAGRAYAMAYRRPVDNCSYVEAHRLLRKPKIIEEIEMYRRIAISEYIKLFDGNKELFKDPNIPAMIKFKALQELQGSRFLRFASKPIVVKEKCSRCAGEEREWRETRKKYLRALKEYERLCNQDVRNDV